MKKCSICGRPIADHHSGQVVWVPSRKYLGFVSTECAPVETRALKANPSFGLEEVVVYISKRRGQTPEEVQAHFKYGRVQDRGLFFGLRFDTLRSNPLRADKLEADGYRLLSIKIGKSKPLPYWLFLELYSAAQRDQRTIKRWGK